MADTDGKTVTPEVSTGTPAEVVKETPPVQVDPIEARVKELLLKEIPTIEERIRRVAQSQTDKRVSVLDRQLQEERARRQAYEGALRTLPTKLGPDADPAYVQSIRGAQTDAELGVYRQQEIQRQQAEQIEAAKRSALEGMRQEVADLGLDPDDPRIEYDLNTPDADTFYKKAMRSAAKAIRENERKSLPELVAQEVAAQQAKARKESGVDSHETPGTVAQDDKAFMRSYAEGKSDDHKRAQKILKGK